MSDIYQRIKTRREELGLTQEELAFRMGYKSKSSINKIEMGKNDIPQSKVIAFAKALETTTAYLMGADEAKERGMPDLNPLPANILPIRMGKPLPLIGNIACGQPILAQENVEMMVECPETVHADFCLRCKGDSMIGCRIMNGDIVYIRQQDDVDDGQIAAVLIEDEATLKRVYKIGADRLELRPENPAYPVMTYTGAELEHIRILGLAVAFTSPVK